MNVELKNNQDLPIALDAMGGDLGLKATIQGALDAVLCKTSKISVILVGDRDKIHAVLESDPRAKSLVEAGKICVEHASEEVAMSEKPALAVRQKKDSSIHVACRLVKEGRASAALSAGNSGAMMAISLFIFKRIRGVIRPCIASLFPSKNKAGFALLVDAGANVDCTKEQLTQFALMGEAYMGHVFELENPSVGLMSNGTEASKGSELYQRTREILVKEPINFIGYVEGSNLSRADLAVLVCDGFVGNVALKTAEGTFKEVAAAIKESYQEAGLFGKLGAALSKPVFEKLKKRFDYREYGSAPLLGLNFPAFIAHGSSDSYAICNGLKAVQRNIEHHAQEYIVEAIEKQQKRKLVEQDS